MHHVDFRLPNINIQFLTSVNLTLLTYVSVMLTACYQSTKHITKSTQFNPKRSLFNE